METKISKSAIINVSREELTQFIARHIDELIDEDSQELKDYDITGINDVQSWGEYPDHDMRYFDGIEIRLRKE